MQKLLTKTARGYILMVDKEKGWFGAMLLQFSCENHKSIKDRITFSTIAGKDTAYESDLKSFGNMNVVRMAAIYGANGSGKSNVISAIDFMRALVVNSINHRGGEGVFQAPHKLADPEMPSSYDIQFVTKGIRYAYGFSVKNNLIEEEYLYYFPKKRQVKIFERKNLEIKPGDLYKNAFELSMNVLKDNRLFLSCAANYTNLKEVEDAFLFFKDDIVVYNPVANNWSEYSAKLLQDNAQIKKLYIDILNVLGTNVKDVKVKFETKKLTHADLPGDMPEFLKDMISSQESNLVEAKMVYEDFEINMQEESTGIQKLFEIICPILDILMKGRILICDEIETGLHEAVVKRILEIFQGNKKDEFAQIIFSTHDTSLLSSVPFRRDQIWFTELDEQRSTDLFSLAEIKNVRKEENLARGYINGKYGAIPMLNSSFSNLFHDE